MCDDIISCFSSSPRSSATLLQFLPQLEEVDVSWNELIGGSLNVLTAHLQHVGGIRVLRLCSCRLTADDITALGGSFFSGLLKSLKLHADGVDLFDQKFC